MNHMVDQLEAPPQEPAKKKGGKKKIFMIVGLIAALGGIYFFMFAGSGGAEVATEDTTPVEGVVIDGATMTVALNDGSGVAHFARVAFAVVLSEGADSAAVGNRIQILQDAALTTIAGFTAEDLRSVEGLDRLRSALTADALVVWPDGEVIRVVLTEVIVQ
jgi:flagellar FliL protein